MIKAKQICTCGQYTSRYCEDGEYCVKQNPHIMTDKKLTAVEWLETQIQKYCFRDLLDPSIITQAKALEREQIELCGDKCQIITDVDPDGNVKFMYKGGSEYFTKNYGDEKES